MLSHHIGVPDATIVRMSTAPKHDKNEVRIILDMSIPAERSVRVQGQEGGGRLQGQHGRDQRVAEGSELRGERSLADEERQRRAVLAGIISAICRR